MARRKKAIERKTSNRKKDKLYIGRKTSNRNKDKQ